VTHDQEEALEVADEIVVINDGTVEQIGPPDALYDAPANDFVMEFLGPVTRLAGRLVRPHDLEIDELRPGRQIPPDAHAGRIVRVARVGPEIRISVALDDHAEPVLVTRTLAHQRARALADGDLVTVRPAVQMSRADPTDRPDALTAPTFQR
jgi:sulfate transport system ATP-binding protein